MNRKERMEKKLQTLLTSNPNWIDTNFMMVADDDMTFQRAQREYQYLLYKLNMVEVPLKELKLIYPDDEQLNKIQEDKTLLLTEKKMVERYLDNDLYEHMYIKSDVTKELFRDFEIGGFAGEVRVPIGLYRSTKTREQIITYREKELGFGMLISYTKGNLNSLKVNYYGKESHELDLLKECFNEKFKNKNVDSLRNTLNEFNAVLQVGVSPFLREIQIDKLLEEEL